VADFSGYIAIDELYEGRHCVLSVVDNRNFHRLMFRVLDHDPTHDDIREFLRDVWGQLAVRGRKVLGITTDASPLYPTPLAEVFSGVPHQVCEFHIIKLLVAAVLHALAKLRKQLAEKAPPLPRGRPNAKTRRKARRIAGIRQQVNELFQHRHLFVQRELSMAERTILARLCRIRPQLAALREIMDEVYRLFDRRRRTATALEKLAALRQRVRDLPEVGRTLSTLYSPNLEKALTFLDDRLLPSTSNAVERSNRRHRKMQKAVYRVRTRHNLCGRIAMDMMRDQSAADRDPVILVLRRQRKEAG
jgi:hypothetical protein